MKYTPCNELEYYFPEDYRYNDCIFSEDEFKLSKIKWIIDNKLTNNEKIFFFFFVENYSNYTKTSKIIGCSTPTLKKYINLINKKIKSYL